MAFHQGDMVSQGAIVKIGVNLRSSHIYALACLITNVTPLSQPSLSIRKDADWPSLTPKGPSTAVITEGIPPISARILEKIRRWEYVDLADLLSESAGKTSEFSDCPGDQVILVQSLDQVRRKKKQIVDISTWLQAFSIYAAALVADPSTTKEESTGLCSHMFLITQIEKDLGGLKWYKYDKEFRERAAATNTRIWGILNLTIYGRCLAAPQLPMSSPNHIDRPAKGRPEKKNRPGKYRNKACFKYNFEISCGKNQKRRREDKDSR